MEQPEHGKRIVALAAGNTTRASYKSILHKSMQIKRIKSEINGELQRLRYTKKAAWRHALVTQPAHGPVTLLSRLRRLKGQGLGVNQMQMELLCSIGVWPLNSNKMPGSKHASKYAKLYKMAKNLPINKAVAEKRAMNEREVEEAVQAFKEHRAQLFAMAACCPKKGLFDLNPMAPCKAASCRVCKK